MNSFIRASNPFHFAVLMLCLAASLASAADVIITSEQKSAEVIALGYVEFRCLRGDPKSVPYPPGTVLSDDLHFSGRFRVQFSPVFDSTARLLFKQDGALAYLRGGYAFEDGRYSLDCELVDIDSGQIILKKHYSGPRQQLRQAVHQFADELVFQLFGEKGVAQTRITYVNRRSTGKEIAVMDYDGANAREVSPNKSINLTPIFLGSKDKILFTSYAAGTPQFFQADMTASKTMQVFSSQGMNSAPNYNGMDREIVYSSTMDGNSEIYRRPLEGGKPVRLTFSESIDTSPSWSPNGYEIVFVSDRGGKPMLYIMDRDGSNLRRVTFDLDYYGSPAWSPKGDRIAFVALEGSNNFNIYTMTPEGKDVIKLTKDAGSNESPSWSPDGRHLVFMSTRTGSPEIFAMGADGSEPRRLTFSGGNSMPSWSNF
jgi:TolB protein